MGLFDGFKKWATDTGFNFMDSNNDGAITKDETKNRSFLYGGRKFNSSTFDDFDTDNNGEVSKEEFNKGFSIEESKENKSSGLSTGAIIGIIVGCVAVIGLIIGLVAYFSSRNAKKRKEEEQKLYEMQQKEKNNGNAGINLKSCAKEKQIT